MNRLNLGLIGYGNVGQGVVKFLRMRENFIRNKFDTEFVMKTICDRSIHAKDTKGLNKTLLTTQISKVLHDPQIVVVI